jgi:hypothetical protein
MSAYAALGWPFHPFLAGRYRIKDSALDFGDPEYRVLGPDGQLLLLCRQRGRDHTLAVQEKPALPVLLLRKHSRFMRRSRWDVVDLRARTLIGVVHGIKDGVEVRDHAERVALTLTKYEPSHLRRMFPGVRIEMIATVDGAEVGRMGLERAHFGKRYGISLAPDSVDPRLALAGFVLTRGLTHPPRTYSGGSGGGGGDG